MRNVAERLVNLGHAPGSGGKGMPNLLVADDMTGANDHGRIETDSTVAALISVKHRRTVPAFIEDRSVG